MMTGDLVSNLHGLLLPQGTCGAEAPQHPKPDEILKVLMETDLHVSAGPEDEFEPDWVLAEGPRPLCCHPSLPLL